MKDKMQELSVHVLQEAGFIDCISRQALIQVHSRISSSIKSTFAKNNLIYHVMYAVHGNLLGWQLGIMCRALQSCHIQRVATRPVFTFRTGTLRVLLPFHWPALATVMQSLVTLVVVVALDPLGYPLSGPSRCALLA
jgi:hypothetical protein